VASLAEAAPADHDELTVSARPKRRGRRPEDIKADYDKGILEVRIPARPGHRREPCTIPGPPADPDGLARHLSRYSPWP